MMAVLLGRLTEWQSPQHSLHLFEEACTCDPSSFSAPFHRGRLIWRFATSAAQIKSASKLLYQALELASQSGDEDDIEEACWVMCSCAYALLEQGLIRHAFARNHSGS